MTTIDGKTLSYDRNGNLTTDTTGRRYTWDSENQELRTGTNFLTHYQRNDGLSQSWNLTPVKN